MLMTFTKFSGNLSGKRNTDDPTLYSHERVDL